MVREGSGSYGGQKSNMSYKLKELAQAEMNTTEGEGRASIHDVIHVYCYIHTYIQTVSLSNSRRSNMPNF